MQDENKALNFLFKRLYFYKCLQGGSGAPQSPELPENAEAGMLALCGGISPLNLFLDTSNSFQALQIEHEVQDDQCKMTDQDNLLMKKIGIEEAVL
ncbi:hypothetical protein BVRB_6g129750 [Beta vulgaris subsp. vulgaris]|nr:hypothetical protein BVRB_6g129750 [Beta vulgaris subsp. vulgaris]